MTDFAGPASSLNAVTARPSDGRQYGAVLTWFKNCTNPNLQDGTEVDAGWLNQVSGFFRNLIGAPGLKLDGVTPVVPIDQSDNMVLNGILQLVQRGQANWAVDTGTADALLATPSVAVAEHKPGMRFLVFKNPTVGANATAAPTINFGLGNLTITKDDASSLAPGDLKKGAIFEVSPDGAGNARLTGLMTISDVLALRQSPVTPYTGSTPQGAAFYAMDLGSQQTFTLPNPAALPSGWYCDLLVTGTPSGYQTAYAQVASGSGSQNLLFRGVAHNPFYLIGGGEILRFLWTGSLWVVMVLANPSISVNVNMTNIGGATTLGGTGAYQYMAINSISGSTSLILSSSTVVALNVPVSGTYRFGASTAFLGANTSYSSATLLLADQISPTVNYDSTLGNCNSAQSVYVKSTTTAFLKQGAGIVGLVNAPPSASSQPNYDTFSLALLSR